MDVFVNKYSVLRFPIFTYFYCPSVNVTQHITKTAETSSKLVGLVMNGVRSHAHAFTIIAHLILDDRHFGRNY